MPAPTPALPPAPAASPWPYPFWIAHRGAGRLAPENTLAAFREGARHGYQAFECDVKLSADGVPFLLHDDTLERTTSGQGPAATWPWAALSQLDAGGWHSATHAGEPPASLQAVGTWLRRNGLHLNLELKPNPGQAHETGAQVARAVAREWAGCAVPPLLSSFEPEALVGARAAAPQLPRALLVDEDRAGWLAEALALGCCAVVTQHRWLQVAQIQAAHAQGLKVLCYTVNDPAEARRLQAAGIDGLITDAIDRFDPRALPTA